MDKISEACLRFHQVENGWEFAIVVIVATLLTYLTRERR